MFLAKPCKQQSQVLGEISDLFHLRQIRNIFRYRHLQILYPVRDMNIGMLLDRVDEVLDLSEHISDIIVHRMSSLVLGCSYVLGMGLSFQF